MLIVCSDPVNRSRMEKTFASVCSVLTAENGTEALVLLRGRHDIFAILLDATISKPAAFSLLETLHADAELCRIPAVVVTESKDTRSQKKALSLGAVDVIGMPLQQELVQRRMENILTMTNAIRAAEAKKRTADSAKVSGTDAKTGLWNRKTFCHNVPEIMAKEPGKSYVLMRWDIDNFSLFNDTYGSDAGDRVIARIGSGIRSCSDPYVSRVMLACCHWDADHFVALLDGGLLKEEQLFRYMSSQLASMFPNFNFSARCGCCRVDKTEPDISAVCDHALLALRSIKNNFNAHYAWYDDSMLQAATEEHEIVTAMREALNAGEFMPYFQPQYNYSTGKLIGAEVLVRWQSPKMGLLFPGKFIPLFEKNGFVFELDSFIWDRACFLLRSWMDAGLPVPPVSVNVSRRDLDHSDMENIFENLLKKYRLESSFLHLEVTESAYMDNPEQLIRTVSSLQSLGFRIEMDDFGSGYSSLNTLKDVPVDLLKLDMKFLSQDTGTGRGGSILSSVVRMAHALNLPVLAEGVETRQQADYLKSIGCFYMQGYYFAKPMTAEAFEALLGSGAQLDPEDERFHNGVDRAADFLNADTQSTLLFNSFVGGAAIVEYDGNNVSVLRTNDHLLEIFGVTREQFVSRQYHLLDLFTPDARKVYLQMLETAAATGKEAGCETCFGDVFKSRREPVWAYSRSRFLARRPGSCIFYVSVENITKRKRLAEENESQRNELNAIISSVPGGVQIYEMTRNGVRRVFSNHAFSSKQGWMPEESDNRVNCDPLLLVHPEDRTSAKRYMEDFKNGTLDSAVLQLRLAIDRNGWRWVMISCCVVARTPECTSVCLVIIDIEKQVLNEHINDMYGNIIRNLPIGVAVYELGKRSQPRYVNDIACRMFGFTRETYQQCSAKDLQALLFPEGNDFPSDLEQRLRRGEVVEISRLHVKKKDGTMFWLRVNLHGVQHESEPLMLYASLTDVSDEVENERIKTEQAFLIEDERAKLQALYSSLPCGVMQYSLTDGRYELIRYNEASYQMFGYRSDEEYKNAMANRSRIADIHPDDRKDVEEHIKQVEETGVSAEFSHRIVCADGSIRRVRVNLQWIGGLSPHSILQSTFVDITDLTAAQHTVSLQQQEMSAVISAIPGGIFKYYADESEQFTYISPGLLDMLGYSCEEFVRKFRNRFSQMVYQEDRAVALGKINSDIAKTGATDSCEYRIEMKNGALKWVFDAGRLTEDENGKKQFLVVVVDIDERKKLEQDKKTRLAMARSVPGMGMPGRETSTVYGLQAHMEAILSHIPSGIAIFRVIGSGAERIYLSPGGLTALGYSADDPISIYQSSSDLMKRVHPDDLFALKAATAEAIAQEKVFNMDIRILLGGSELRRVNLTANPVRGDDGALYYYGVYTDITQRQAAIGYAGQRENGKPDNAEE